MFNIMDPNNLNLRKKILLEEVKLQRLINMSSEEKASSARQCETKKINDKATYEGTNGWGNT